MIFYLIAFSITLGILLYLKSWQHPEKFPPGPKIPLPIIGHLYKLDKKDFPSSLRKLSYKYGKIFGLWFGGERCVMVADFDVIQDIMNRKEAVDRPPMKGGGKFQKKFLHYVIHLAN